MSETMFITLMIIFNFILIVLMSIPFFYQFKGVYLQMMFQKSIGYAKDILGYLITIFGKIRKGKTSSASAEIHIFTIVFQQQLVELIQNTKVKFKMIDFNVFDEIILNSIFSYEDRKILFDEITNNLIDIFQLNEYGHFYDFIKDKSIYEMIYDYVFAIYVLYVRNNYVLSNIPIYNRITGNYSYDLDTRWLEVKNAYKNRDFGIDDYMILFIDEITDDKGASLWTLDAKDDSGYKEYLRKFGQYHQERNRLITTKQDAFDEVKKNRNLTQSNLEIKEKVRTVNTYREILYVIKLGFFFQRLLYWTWVNLKFISKVVIRPKMIKGLKDHRLRYMDYHFSRINYERNVQNRLYFWDQFLFSLGFNVYSVKNYENVDDVGKKDEGDPLNIFVPVIYAFGTYDTHLAKHDFKELKSVSNTVIRESNPYDVKSRFSAQEERGVNDDVIAL